MWPAPFSHFVINIANRFPRNIATDWTTIIKGLLNKTVAATKYHSSSKAEATQYHSFVFLFFSFRLYLIRYLDLCLCRHDASRKATDNRPQQHTVQDSRCPILWMLDNSRGGDLLVINDASEAFSPNIIFHMFDDDDGGGRLTQVAARWQPTRLPII